MEKTAHNSKGNAAHRFPFLGKGWAFPPGFSKVDGELDMVAGAVDVQQSLTLLLGTHPGERKMNPGYGVDLTPLLFESLTLTLKTRITDTIERAILKYEPRIILDDVHFELKAWEGVLFITLYYTIQSTNSRTNLVYPFYLTEGTDL